MCSSVHAQYLYSVGLDEVHVERRGVGQDFAASRYRTQDVGPHVGQLRYGGSDDLPGLNRRLVTGTRSAAAGRIPRRGGRHVVSRAASRFPSQRRDVQAGRRTTSAPARLLPGALSNQHAPSQPSNRFGFLISSL